MLGRNLLATGTFVVSASLLIQISRGRRSSLYASCTNHEVVSQVFSSSGSLACIGTYPANDPCEDRNVYHEESGFKIAGVFDGHGGWNVSEYASKILIPKLLSRLKQSYLDKCLDDTRTDADTISTFNDVESSYIDSVRKSYLLGYGGVASVGSCVCLAIKKDDRLTIANCGDCRAVLGSDISQNIDGSSSEARSNSKYVATRLSRDHNARIPLEVLNLQEQHPGEEKEDVVRCHVNSPTACYVKGRLQLTRSLGDLYLKYEDFNAQPGQPRSMGRHIPAPYSPPYVSHIPDMTHIRLDASDRFVIVASDGLWDFLSDEEAVATVAECIRRNDKNGAGSALVTAALKKASEECDMTLHQLQSLPLGKHRRGRHDDTTAVVMYL